MFEVENVFVFLTEMLLGLTLGYSNHANDEGASLPNTYVNQLKSLHRIDFSSSQLRIKTQSIFEGGFVNDYEMKSNSNDCFELF